MGKVKSIDTFALLDDASTVSLIDQDLAEDLDLEGPIEPLNMQWTNEQVNEQKDSRVVSMRIKGTFSGAKTYLLRRVRTLQGLQLPRQTCSESMLKFWQFLKNIPDLTLETTEPKLLIGQDNWPVIVSRDMKYSDWDGPAASKTLLGWVVHGNCAGKEKHETNFTFTINTNVGDDLDAIHCLIKDQWKLETDMTSKDIAISADDKRCEEIFAKTINRKNDKLECGLFWAKDNLKLPESYSTAYERLCHIEKRFQKDEEYYKKYSKNLNDYIGKGYLKKLSKTEASISTPKTYYLPHFGVTNVNKPGKLRIVFDAAAKTGKYCLNDFFFIGPDLYNSLSTVLLNFRQHKIAFTADIKEMFLQIGVIPEDRHAQRILWRDKGSSDPPDIYEIQVIFFGAKCSPSIAQQAKNFNAKDFESQYPKACEDIILKHYMDDYLGGADSEKDAIELIKDVIYVHERGGFEICNWSCNNKNVLSQIDERLLAKNSIDIFESKQERVLGLTWNIEKDEFLYQLKFQKIDGSILNARKRPTKRDVLKVVMSVFDPLGFLANFLIAGKVLLQAIWQSQIQWDEVINDDQLVLWEKWCQTLNECQKFRVPRKFSFLDIEDCNVQLHIFVDASKQAYAACAYLRFDDGFDVDCSLILAKARVAPLKPMSIPRLELQAALIGARMAKNLKFDLGVDIKKIILWSDSEVVLHWIRSTDKRMKTFVAHRLGEIRELTNVSDWRYVPSASNIADDATKIKAIDFSNKSIWIKGPNFLYKNSDQWPKSKFLDLSKDDQTEYVNFISTKKESIILPDLTKFNEWWKFLRAIAWLLRFIDIKVFRKPIESNELVPYEIERAEKLIYRKIQIDSFADEINSLTKNKSVSSSSKLKLFPIKYDNDKLIRLNGRLRNIQQTEFEGNPIILDHKHPITALIIDHYHRKNNHIGNETILSDLRKSFWITNCRRAVKKCALMCQKCKNRKAQPQIPMMGQLPSCRVQPTARPFVKTGVDYFGPIEVTLNRKHVKRWGVIFTCMVTRAVHLEIAEDLSANAFMHVFRQFGCRRGFPKELYSDNGTNFKKADKEIRTAIDSWPEVDIMRVMTMRKCKWFFNPPLAPHMGGAWERLIQSIKKHLAMMLNERYPKEYVLRTLFCEIENIINSRPLTHVPLDSYDSDPIRPIDLLIGPNGASLQLADTDDRDLCVLDMWKATQRLADIFWKKWKVDYRQYLLTSPKWINDRLNLSIGDVVVVVDSETPRNVWPKGIISKVYTAKDGKVRVVDVQTVSGTFKRPVTKIIKLDVTN